MKFDVIIGNPPYQISDGGGTGTSAKPIYHLFIEQAKKLCPNYLVMIIPSRWYSGGKGLDKFRQEMLNDNHIRKIVDYGNYKDVFPSLGGLAGGVCYFLWDKNNPGLCEIVNVDNNKRNSMIRRLNEYEFLVRSNEAVKIVNKIFSIHKGNYLDSRVSTRLPFGITTTYLPMDSGIPCYFTQKIGLKFVNKNDLTDELQILNKWKFLIPKAPIAGQTDFSKPVAFYYEGNTRIARPGECCTESWLVAGAFDSEKDCLNFKSYLLSKIPRFLLLQTVVSQNITKKNFCFVPDLGNYDVQFNDDMLRKLWNIDDDEWDYIKSKIGEIGVNNESNEE